MRRYRFNPDRVKPRTAAERLARRRKIGVVMMLRKEISSPDYWADWLVDAVATATQDRRFLRGDPAEDKYATESIFLNGKKAMENLLRHVKAEVKS